MSRDDMRLRFGQRSGRGGFRRHRHQSIADVMARPGWDLEIRIFNCRQSCCMWRKRWYTDYQDAKRAWPANASVGLRQHRTLLDVIAGGGY